MEDDEENIEYMPDHFKLAAGQNCKAIKETGWWSSARGIEYFSIPLIQSG
jgi:hypothetical protein